MQNKIALTLSLVRMIGEKVLLRCVNQLSLKRNKQGRSSALVAANPNLISSTEDRYEL